MYSCTAPAVIPFHFSLSICIPAPPPLSSLSTSPCLYVFLHRPGCHPFPLLPVYMYSCTAPAVIPFHFSLSICIPAPPPLSSLSTSPCLYVFLHRPGCHPFPLLPVYMYSCTAPAVIPFHFSLSICIPAPPRLSSLSTSPCLYVFLHRPGCHPSPLLPVYMYSCTAPAVIPFHFSLSICIPAPPRLSSLSTSPCLYVFLHRPGCHPFPLLPVYMYSCTAPAVIPFHFSLSICIPAPPRLSSLSTSPCLYVFLHCPRCHPFPLLPVYMYSCTAPAVIPFHFSLSICIPAPPRLSSPSTSPCLYVFLHRPGCHPLPLLPVYMYSCTAPAVIPFHFSLSICIPAPPRLSSLSTSPCLYVFLHRPGCHPFPLLPVYMYSCTAPAVIPFHFSLSICTPAPPRLSSLSTSPCLYVFLHRPGCHPFPLLPVYMYSCTAPAVIPFHFSLSICIPAPPRLSSLSTSPCLYVFLHRPGCHPFSLLPVYMYSCTAPAVIPFHFSLSICIPYVDIKGTFLYSAVSSPWDCSKRFTLHPLVDLFIPVPSQPHWESFSHIINNRDIIFYIFNCGNCLFFIWLLSHIFFLSIHW